MASRRVTAISSKGFASHRDISSMLPSVAFGTWPRGPLRISIDAGKGLWGQFWGLEAQDFEALRLFEGSNCEARWAMQVIGASYGAGGDSFTVVSVVANIAGGLPVFTGTGSG